MSGPKKYAIVIPAVFDGHLHYHRTVCDANGHWVEVKRIGPVAGGWERHWLEKQDD